MVSVCLSATRKFQMIIMVVFHQSCQASSPVMQLAAGWRLQVKPPNHHCCDLFLSEGLQHATRHKQ